MNKFYKNFNFYNERIEFNINDKVYKLLNGFIRIKKQIIYHYLFSMKILIIIFKGINKYSFVIFL